MIKMQLDKDTARVALTTHLNTLKRKRDKEPNMLIVELLDKDIGIINTAINSITDAK